MNKREQAVGTSLLETVRLAGGRFLPGTADGFEHRVVLYQTSMLPFLFHVMVFVCTRMVSGPTGTSDKHATQRLPVCHVCAFVVVYRCRSTLCTFGFSLKHVAPSGESERVLTRKKKNNWGLNPPIRHPIVRTIQLGKSRGSIQRAK